MSDSKEQRLRLLAEVMQRELDSGLAVLREQENQQFVFGQGDPEARVVFVGEAPGRQEAETGEPFVGAAGKLLTSLIESIGLERGRVYITNVVKDRPPGNRRPRKAEIEAYRPFLCAQLEIIEPEVIVPLGLVSTRVLLAEFAGGASTIKMKNVHGQEFTDVASWGQVVLLPMYHPAASFYGSLSQADLEADFERLKDVLRRE